MPGLNDYGSRYVKAVADRDRAAAAALISEVQAALASGHASGSGFEDDLRQLAEIAGVSLTKAAPTRAEPLEKRDGALPPHLVDEVNAAIARIKAASRLEKAAAIAAGRAIQQRCEDFRAGRNCAEELIKAAQRAPQRRLGP